MTVLTDMRAPVTPTGIIAYDGDPHTDEWFATRRRGITGTDLPKILGLSDYGTARHVWLDKQGLLPLDESESEAAFWGTTFEDPVARVWAARNDTTVSTVGILAHADTPWQLASLDRLVDRCPIGCDPCGLEVKTRSAFMAGKWRDDVPDDVLAQVQWGIHVSGLDHMHVAVLLGGQRMEEFLIDRDGDVIRYLVGHAERLWGQVRSGEMPTCEPTAALGRLLDAIHADRSGDVEVDALTGDALRADYLDACREVRDAEARKDRAKVSVLDHLSNGTRLVVSSEDGPRPIFEYLPRSKTTVSVKEAKRDPELWASIQAAGAVKVSNYRQIACRSDGEGK